MSATIPPPRRPELILRPTGTEGGFVVKDPATRTYFQLGGQETFLLEQLDGKQTVEAICQAFENRFKEPLSPEDLEGFVDLAREQHFLQTGTSRKESSSASVETRVRSILFWRKSLCDPDRFLGWLVPRLGFVFTRTFVLLSLLVIGYAGVTFYLHRNDFIRFIPRSYEAILLFWVTVVLSTALHELSHGLACKKHGGEVHEIGFLMMFFMPCFYCDVSDAWLFREKSKRLWVTAAGAYCDLCIWALGIFVWRLTLPGTWPGAIASVVVSVCGIRVFFNAIPLLKLDGYYFLSDYLEVPNLRTRSLGRVMDYARWLLWGDSRPEPVSKGRALLTVGLATWGFSCFFLILMLFSLTKQLLSRWGPLGGLGVAFLAWLSIPNLFVGFSKGEIMKMFRFRPNRLVVWGVLIAAGIAALILIPMQEKATGPFRVRPSSRAEIRSPVSGFLQMVYRVEGQEVEAGSTIAVLDIPDLHSKIAEKQAEVQEARAKLSLLEAGPRKEEIAEHRLKVERAKDWRDLAEKDLARKRQALVEELTRLKQAIQQYTIERDNALENLELSKKLYERKALALDQLRDWDKRHQIATALVKQAEAQERERSTVGVQDQEAELARRVKEWADAKATLSLLEIGTRPEEIEAQRACLKRLEQSLSYLGNLKEKVRVTSLIAGIVTTPYLNEKIGAFFKEGDLICEVENVRDLEVEIPLQEQEVGPVQIGQEVELKARALPFDTLKAKVHRIAPAAVKSEKPELNSTSQNTFLVYCNLNDAKTQLYPGMTGYARIYCGQHSVGYVGLVRALRYLRTEVWW